MDPAIAAQFLPRSLLVVIHTFCQRGNCSAGQMQKAPRVRGYGVGIVMYLSGCGGAHPTMSHVRFVG